MNNITTSYLAKKVKGKLIGDEKPITGIFTFLNHAKPGDVVVRHWIDEQGIEIAAQKKVSCIVTQNPRGKTVEIADKLGIPIIITSKIEFANAFAIKWAIKNFAKNSLRVVVTGTNGKSTTAHMIYTILKNSGYNTYTNTDAKSEFNTLIDPVVAKQIAEFESLSGEKIQAMVVEVSEVQGWLDKLMKDHAHLMTSAVNPKVVVITNISLDHIGLINSIEETFNEIYGSLKAVSNKSHRNNSVVGNISEDSYAILNSDDPLLVKMGHLVENQDIQLLFYGSNPNGSSHPDITIKPDGIYNGKDLFLKTGKLPFKSKHFIQNTMAAISACIALNIDKKSIKKAVTSYTPLNRRFTVLGTEPLVIDDFAHNPDGIIATIQSTAKICNGVLYVVFAIRGSRGESINILNTKAVVKGLEEIDHDLIITSSAEVVDDANTVTNLEKTAVLETLEKKGQKYRFQEKLISALEYSVKSAEEIDTILLIGAQGMDSASEVLKIYIRIQIKKLSK